MIEWFRSLSNPYFMPHGHCYLWQPDVLWTHVISDSVIALAYYAIPVVLGLFLYKRKQDIPYKELVALFVAFIFLCGTTHLMAVYVTWIPAYELEGWIKALTALVSIYTAVRMVPMLPELIADAGIKLELKKSRSEIDELQTERARMQLLLDVAMEREQRIVHLKRQVNSLLQELGREPAYLKESDE